jgi:hypothetical protein
MNDKWKKAQARQLLQKMVTAVAREQGGVVDLDKVKRDIRIAFLLNGIDGAGLIEADKAEEILRDLEGKLVVETMFSQPTIAEMRAAQPAEHRAARGVRKVRGAK